MIFAKGISTGVLTVLMAASMLAPTTSVVLADPHDAWRDSRRQEYRPKKNYNYNKHNNHRRDDYRRHDKHKNKKYYKKSNNDDLGAALAVGAIGLAAGALLGSAMSAPEPIGQGPVYAPPPPAYPNGGGYYYEPEAGAPIIYNPPPETVITYSPQPWTPEWYAYCSRKFRSFNPNTGTYTTYSGVNKLCQ